MSDPNRLRENFERNREEARQKPFIRKTKAERKRRKRRLVFGTLMSLLGLALLFPGKVADVVDDVLSLRQTFISLWLNPQRWEGLYSSRPEAYVDSAQMNLSEELNVFLTLYFEPEVLEFDGEVISSGFCESGWPYQNILLRGHPNLIQRNRIRIEVYDFVGGERIDFGTINAVIEPPIIELEGWIFPEGSRLALDPQLRREELDTMCIGPPVE